MMGKQLGLSNNHNGPILISSQPSPSNIAATTTSCYATGLGAKANSAIKSMMVAKGTTDHESPYK